MAPEGEKEGNISELLTRNAKLDQILSQIVKKNYNNTKIPKQLDEHSCWQAFKDSHSACSVS